MRLRFSWSLRSLYWVYSYIDFTGPSYGTSNIAPEMGLTQDHGLGFAFAVEFGVANGMTWWPIVGGLTRLVKKRRTC